MTAFKQFPVFAACVLGCTAGPAVAQNPPPAGAIPNLGAVFSQVMTGATPALPPANGAAPPVVTAPAAAPRAPMAPATGAAAPVPAPAPSAAALPQSSLAATVPASTIQPAPQLARLQVDNPFDAQRRMWPDRVPAVPPPPPPPPPPAVTEQDLQLYGVAIVAGRKLATVKVGSRFADVAQGGRSFATLNEGQALGEFTVSRIEPGQIVLQSRGGQQAVPFTKKNDRTSSAVAQASAAPPPVQAATEAPVQAAVAAPAGQAVPAGAAPAGTATSLQVEALQGAAAAMAQQQQPQHQSSVGAADGNSAQRGPATSLVEALAAVRARAAAQGGGAQQPPPAFANPFQRGQ